MNTMNLILLISAKKQILLIFNILFSESDYTQFLIFCVSCFFYLISSKIDILSSDIIFLMISAICDVILKEIESQRIFLIENHVIL